MASALPNAVVAAEKMAAAALAVAVDDAAGLVGGAFRVGVAAAVAVGHAAPDIVGRDLFVAVAVASPFPVALTLLRLFVASVACAHQIRSQFPATARLAPASNLLS